MDGALEALRKEFAGPAHRPGSPSLLEPVTVEAYGSEMPLNQVGDGHRAGAADADASRSGTAAW